MWFVIVTKRLADRRVLLHRAPAVVHRQRVPLALLHERIDDEVGGATGNHAPVPRALALEVLRRLRRRQVRVRRGQVAGERRGVEVGPELAQVVVALGELPEHEVGVRPDTDEAVAPELHAPGPVCDDVGKRLLARRPLLDRQPSPERIDAVERVCDVLRAVLLGHGAIVPTRVTGFVLPSTEARARSASGRPGALGLF